MGWLTLQKPFTSRQQEKKKKKPHSPLGRFAKTLTSMSLVLLAGLSFSSKENSFWKLRGQGKIPTVTETGLSCGKHDLFIEPHPVLHYEQSQFDQTVVHIIKNMWLEAAHIGVMFKNLINQPMVFG